MLDTIPPTAEPTSDTPTFAVKKPRETTTITGSILTITLPDGSVETYDAHAVHNDSAHALKMVGLRDAMRTSTDRPKTYAALQAGTFGVRAPAGPKDLDPWRMAIAHAVVEETKKSDVPLTLDQAKEKAAAVTRDQLVVAKRSPLVVKHYAKLNPTESGSVTGLLG